MCGKSAAARSGKTDALRITSFDALLSAKGMERIEEEVGARLPLHRLWLEPQARTLPHDHGRASIAEG
jgi:hypothetical protein